MPRLIDHGARRTAYAEATWRVIRSRGIDQMSVRNVAQEAGVSIGSLRHLFPTQASLASFAMALVAHRVEDRIRAIEPVADPLESAKNLLLEVLPLDETRRAEAQVWLAFSAAAVADSALAQVHEEQFTALASLCRKIVDDLEEMGRLDPGADRDLEARRLHALVDGLTLHATTAGADWARSVLVEHLRQITSG